MHIDYQPTEVEPTTSNSSIICYYEVDKPISYTNANSYSYYTINVEVEIIEEPNLTDWKALARYYKGFVGSPVFVKQSHIFKCPNHRDRIVNKRKNFIKRCQKL